MMVKMKNARICKAKQIIKQWNRERKKVYDLDAIIYLDGAKQQDLFLRYRLSCIYGWDWDPRFIIESRNQEETAKRVSKCNSYPYWVWKDENCKYNSSGSLSQKLECAIASFYFKKKIPRRIKNEISAHYLAINKVTRHCGKYDTDNLPSD